MKPAKKDIEGDPDTHKWVLSMRARISIGGLCFFLFIGLLAYTNAPHFVQALHGLGQGEIPSDGGNVSGPELVWDRIYGEHRIDRVTGIVQHQDGGLILAQTRFNYNWLEVNPSSVINGGGGMIVLAKIDAAGNKVWERSYGDVGKVYHTASIVESGDGGFLLTGQVLAYGLLPNGTLTGQSDWRVGGVTFSDPELWSSTLSTYLVKIDGDGQVVWEKTYPEMYRPSSVVSDGDGGFLLAGEKIVDWAEEELWGQDRTLIQDELRWWVNETTNLLMRINKDGEKIWQDSGNGADCILGTGDGGFVGLSNTEIFKGDANHPGVKFGSKHLTLPGSGVDMIESGDGGIIVSSSEGVYKFDDNLNIVWSRRLSSSMSRSYLAGSGDGGVVTAFSGRTAGPPLGTTDFSLFRFDPEGNVVWNRSYENPVRDLGGYGTYWDDSMGLVPSEEGGLVIAGTMLGDLRVLKIDAMGDPVWDRIHGSRDFPLDVVDSRDGGYVVAGFTQKGSMGRDAYLTRIDNEGEKVWEVWYGGPATDSFEGVVPSGDDGFVAVGFSSSFRSDRDVYVLKIDGDGHKVWEKTYGTSEQDWAEDIVPSPGGGFLVVGNTESIDYDSSYLYVLRIDESGEKIWERNYAYEDQNYAHGVARSGNGYIIGGETGRWTEQDEPRTLFNSSILSGKTYLLKIDDRGDVAWERTYDGDPAHSITKSSDGGFAVTTYPVPKMGWMDASPSPVTGMVYCSTTFKMNDYGEKIWETPLIDLWSQAWGFLVTGVCDGGFILAGHNLSRVDAEGELVWWSEGPKGWKSARNWWLYPYAMEGGGDGTFLLAGLTQGPFFVGGDWFEINFPGVMHIAKFRDPDLAARCPGTIPEPIVEPALLLVVSSLLLLPLLFLLIPGLLRRARGT